MQFQNKAKLESLNAEFCKLQESTDKSDQAAKASAEAKKTLTPQPKKVFQLHSNLSNQIKSNQIKLYYLKCEKLKTSFSGLKIGGLITDGI
jgi:hypothetical protein